MSQSDTVAPVVAGTASRRRLPRAITVLLSVVGLVVVAWFGYQVYLHVGDARATDQRLDVVTTAWTSTDDATRARAATDASVLPASLPSDPFRQMGTTTLAGHRAQDATVVVGANDGTCGTGGDGEDWQAFVRETDDVVVVLLRPRTSWLPDVPGAIRAVRGSACAGVGIVVPVRVALAAPLGDRLLVDAGSGAASVGDVVSSGQVTTPQNG